eukprot:TRINITY_DN1463_c0_g1_i3.p1 TRINITY_DN1463_c0_g1~~TRINITY_DN1463_c0_g1_i3.p1  ORF type:complete len:263 (-),score=46.47 TRINITY_DN1463_c0_g1_i3:725-1402(-)
MQDGLMSSMFDRYEQEFKETVAALSRELTAFKELPPDIRVKKSSDLEGSLGSARDALSGLEQEAAGVPAINRDVARATVAKYSSELARLESEVTAAVSGCRREALLSGATPRSGGGGGGAGEEHRTRLAAATEKLRGSGETLTKARQLAAATEELGGECMRNLGQQREQLDRNYNVVKQTSGELGRSRSILADMRKKAIMQKLMIGGTILLLLVAIALILYFRFR